MMKHRAKGGLCTATLLLMLSWSCTDDPLVKNDEQSDQTIRFYSHLSTESTKTRSQSGSMYESFTAEKCDNSDMYLVTVVEDGIDGTKLASYNKDAENEAYAAMTMAQSRAAQINSADDLVEKYLKSGDWSIALYGYKYPAKTTYSGVAAASATFQNIKDECGDDVVNFINGTKLVYDSEAAATAGKAMLKLADGASYRWEAHNANRFTFFGLFPSRTDLSQIYQNASYVNLTASTMTATDQTFRYYMDTTPSSQIDILYASANYAGNAATTVDLAMKHIMTGVNVSLGSGFSDCYIKSISIGNVNSYGIFNLATGEWETLSGSNKYTRSITYTCGENEEISDLSNSLFMVIPQPLGTSSGGIVGNCNMTVVVHNKTTDLDETYTRALSGEWPIGKTVKYQLSVNRGFTEYYITTEYTTMKYGWDGNPAGNGTAYTETVNNNAVTRVTDLGNIRVKSYKSFTDDSGTTITDVPFTSQAYTVDSSDNVSATTTAVTIGATSTPTGVDVTDYRTYSTTEENYQFKAKDYNYMFKATMKDKQSSTESYSTDFYKIYNNRGQYKMLTTDGTTCSTAYANRVDLSLYSQNAITSKTYPQAIRWKTTSDGTTYSRYSSNCYMIKYPGYYMIPCAYGNAIYKDTHHQPAYQLGTSTNGNSNNNSNSCMKNLKNYKNGNISSNWINKNDGTGDNPAGAKLVWQDVPGLIKDVSLHTKSTNGEYFVFFTVAQDKIEPGNAVLAVTNSSGTIMWSWHIWVTPYAYAMSDVNNIDSNKLGTSGAQAQKYLTTPLGYVLSSSKVWEARKYKVRLTQTEGDGTGNKYTDVLLWQERHVLPRVSCCYYQWGRKDPFPGIYADETSGAMAYDGSYETTITPRKVYDINSAVKELTLTYNTNMTVNIGIQYPDHYFIAHEYSDGSLSNRFPDDNNYYDLWGTLSDYSDQDNSKNLNTFNASIGSTSRKTVYDPCPPGFKVPPVYMMPAITWTGGNAAATQSKWVNEPTEESALYENYVNTPFSSHTEFVNTVGYTFYCAQMTGIGTKVSSKGTYNLNAFGNIDTAGKYVGYGQNARYWTASSWVSSFNTGNKNHSMVSLYIAYSNGASSFIPILGNTESYGCPVLGIFDTQYPAY